MATIGTNNPTLLDLQTRMDPNGKIAQIIEQLNQTNEIIQDMTLNVTMVHLTKRLYVLAYHPQHGACCMAVYNHLNPLQNKSQILVVCWKHIPKWIKTWLNFPMTL